MANVAFLGLGVMGFPMAGWLAKKGHNVTVYNRTAAKAEKWCKQHGGKAAATPADGGGGRRDRVQLRRRRSRSARDRARLGRRHRRDARGLHLRRSHDGLGRRRARDRGGRQQARRALPRRARVGRPGRRRERQAHGHGRRRGRAVRDGRARDPLVRAGRALAGPGRLRPAHEDGQSDRDRRRRAGPRRGAELRAQGGARRRDGRRDDLEGRRAVVADGEPLEDDERRQVRLRLRRRMDAQGLAHLLCRRRATTAPSCPSPRSSISSTPTSSAWAANVGTLRA